MKEKECPGCAVDVDVSEVICPVCGYEFPKQPLSMKVAVWVFIALLLLWILF